MLKLFDEHDAEYIPEDIGDDATIDDAEETDPLAKIQKLKSDLRVCNKERKDYLDGWQRTKADYLNNKKRFEEERAQIGSRREVKVIEKLLPLCDSFEMALKQLGTDEDTQNQWKSGLLQVNTQLTTLLTSLNITAVGEPGETFDPQVHEALSNQTVTDEAKHDTVVAVLQKGYRREGILIRPAKVIIGIYGS